MDALINLSTRTGYCSINKSGRANEDRFRILGTTQIETDNRVGPAGCFGASQLFAVMDGVGGAPQGMQAAQHVADQLLSMWLGEFEPLELFQSLAAAVQKANRDIHDWGYIDGTDRPLGATTITCFTIENDGRGLLLHAGDCRAYRYNGNSLIQATPDQGTGNNIIQYVGLGEAFKAHTDILRCKESEAFLLLTDGVTKALSKHDISLLAKDYYGEPDLLARRLCERAKQRGVQDDATALVLEIDELG